MTNILNDIKLKNEQAKNAVLLKKIAIVRDILIMIKNRQNIDDVVYLTDKALEIISDGIYKSE